jgi:hypothetical protein
MGIIIDTCIWVDIERDAVIFRIGNKNIPGIGILNPFYIVGFYPLLTSPGR